MTEQTMVALTLQEAVNHLLNGEVLIMKGYERTYKGDVLVRLGSSEDNAGLTYISYYTNLENLSWGGRFWAVNYVPLSAFVLYPTYVFDENYVLLSAKIKQYLKDDTIVYHQVDDKVQSDVVQNYKLDSETKELMVQLKNTDAWLQESSLVKL